MGTLGNPKTWAPYMNPKDCTQGFCGLSCPQGCYLVFPPPPFVVPDDHEKSQFGSNFSPLVIAVIGILASAFLLVSYYAIISKFCGKSTSRDDNSQALNEDHMVEDENDHNLDPSHHEPWLMTTNGLDEALIKTITLVKYKKRDGLVGCSVCSICLGELQEDDTLRLLPKCSHAFHVACIDTWLKSHSNCPLCRANIVSTFAQPVLPPPPPPPFIANIIHHHDEEENRERNGETTSSEQEREMGFVEQASGNSPKSPFRAFSDPGDLGLREIIVTEGADHRGIVRGNFMRRSISMDHPRETRVSIPEISRYDQAEVCELEDNHSQLHDHTLKEADGECSKSIVGSTNAKFLFCKYGSRGRNTVIPV